MEPETTKITSSGALTALSGEATGRVPTAKRLVDHPESSPHVFWESDACIPISEASFEHNKETAVDFLNGRERLFVVDGYASWDPECLIKARIICARPYHALFMHNMMIRPTEEELEDFGEPDVVVFNAGQQKANSHIPEHTSKTSVNLDLERNQLVILGTEYAGEMKKGLFTVMHWLMPGKGHVSMHCSANTSLDGDNACLFFGLSGTGKTTLSADESRLLVGDDEHVWTDKGIFNIEGGCYAKAVNLSAEQEPLIYNAIKFGAVLENVVYDENRDVDFTDTSITENTRCSYPIEYIPNAKIPCIAGHPNNIVLLTCDAFGVIPPVSKLTIEQAMYHFINGYTAKVAGTEMGVKEPTATFSACYGEAFLVRHPSVYAEILAQKMKDHGAHCYLVNTGWNGGAYGEGKRMSIKATRSIIDAIHDGSLADAPTVETEVFGFHVPTEVNGVDPKILVPKNTWKDKDAFDSTIRKLASMYVENNKKYESGNSDAINAAGPNL